MIEGRGIVPTNIAPNLPRNSSPMDSSILKLTRSFNSAAAFSVKVKATISEGSTPSWTKETILRAKDSVLPEPAHPQF